MNKKIMDDGVWSRYEFLLAVAPNLPTVPKPSYHQGFLSTCSNLNFFITVLLSNDQHNLLGPNGRQYFCLFRSFWFILFLKSFPQSVLRLESFARWFGSRFKGERERVRDWNRENISILSLKLKFSAFKTKNRPNIGVFAILGSQSRPNIWIKMQKSSDDVWINVKTF